MDFIPDIEAKQTGTPLKIDPSFTNYYGNNHRTNIQRLEDKLDSLIDKMNRIETLIIRASHYQLPPHIKKEDKEDITCHKLSLDIGIKDFYRSIDQSTETFSCSNFEMKEGI